MVTVGAVVTPKTNKAFKFMGIITNFLWGFQSLQERIKNLSVRFEFYHKRKYGKLVKILLFYLI